MAELIGEVLAPEVIEGEVNTPTTIEGEVKIPQSIYEKDYRKLINKPSINGEELVDNYNEVDPTVPEWSKQPTKPTYNYSDTGAVGGENQVQYSEIDRMFNAVFGI